MNPQYLLTALLCLAIYGSALGQAQDLDEALTNLATKIAAPVKEQAKKKITVLDFTDLQGNTSELGKYIAEQLTINLVMGKREFAVLDRANLRKILAEHKLTATGLVDPENAKKLGQFAGVDALILGTITPIGTNIQLTAKVITTDTAEIVGAAKGLLRLSPEVDLLLTNTTVNSQPSADGGGAPLRPADVSKAVQIDKNSQQIGDLLVKVDSVLHSKAAPGFGNQDALIATLVIANANAAKAFSIALTYNASPSKLTNKRGDEFNTGQFVGWLTGLGQVQNTSRGYEGQFTSISSGKAVKATIKFWSTTPTFGDYPPYRLVLPLVVAEEVDGRYGNSKLQTFMIDVEPGK